MNELISIGSLGRNDGHDKVEQVYVYNCSFTKTTNGARIKTLQVFKGDSKIFLQLKPCYHVCRSVSVSIFCVLFFLDVDFVFLSSNSRILGLICWV